MTSQKRMAVCIMASNRVEYDQPQPTEDAGQRPALGLPDPP